MKRFDEVISKEDRKILLMFRSLLKKNQITFDAKNVRIQIGAGKSVYFDWITTESDYNDYELFATRDNIVKTHEKFRTFKEKVIRE